MVTFSVTIDEESNKELFLQMMKELKFVISVEPYSSKVGLNTLELSLPGRYATDQELEDLMILAEEGEAYKTNQSKELNDKRFESWQGKKHK